MRSEKSNAIIIFLLFLVLSQLIFNIYFFFIRKGVGPQYYIHRIAYPPEDRILEYPIYQDLREEYYHLNQMYKGKFVTVFVGDSITKRFNLNEFNGSDRILNRGIFSDTTYGLLERIDKNINNLKTKNLFLMIGNNDLEYRSNEEIVFNIKKILNKSRAENIFIQSILPVCADNFSYNKRIVEINNTLRKIADSDNYIYIDVYSQFIDEKGGINQELTRDGTHPNYFGYKIWYSVIKKYL